MPMLQLTEGSSDKFYEIRILDDGSNSVLIRYGRRGAQGKTMDPIEHDSFEDATAFVEKTVREKEKKGYAPGKCVFWESFLGGLGRGGEVCFAMRSTLLPP